MVKHFLASLFFLNHSKPSDAKEEGCKDCHLYAKALNDVQNQLKVTQARLEELSIAYSQLVRHCNQVNAAVNVMARLPSNNDEGYSTDTNTEDPAPPSLEDVPPLLDNSVLYSLSYPQWPYVFPKPTAIDLNYWKRNSISPFCPRCYEDFSSSDDRRMHYRKAHFNVYYSERKFERASWMPLYRFMSQSFGDLDDERVCTYGCEGTTQYTSRIELAQHMEKEHLKTLQRLSLAFFKLIEEDYGYVDPQAQTADYEEMYSILAKIRPPVDE